MLAVVLGDDRTEEFRRWISAGVLIAGVHFAGGALALMQWPEDDSSSELTGAIIMELAPMAVVPPEQQDLALGPQAEDAMPTPPPTEASLPEDIELPPVEESPLAPEPEVTLPKAQEIDEVQELKEPELLQMKQLTELNTAAAVATAPPKVDAAVAPVVKAQTAGTTTKRSNNDLTWQKALIFHLNRHKRYPAAARNNRVQGVCKVEFKIDGAGKLVDARIVKGSGSPLLDAEALEVLRRASPFPAPPAAGHVRLALPIEFRIR